MMKIYLSNPGLICGAGTTPEEFFSTITSGSQRGIKTVQCGKNEDGNPQNFFVGRIDDKELKPTGDKFDMRVLQILDHAMDSLAPSINKAIDKYGTAKIGVCVGSCDNGSYLSFQAHKEFFGKGAFPADYDLKAQGADYPSTFISKKFNLKGISLAFSTACSSSASAIIKASEFIKAGICDAVIAGGVDVASDTVLLGFNSLEAVSTDSIANPMSKNRHGITLGEGASFFVLSRDDLDETGIYLAGCGESADASHMTAPLADGSGAAQAMKAALESANLTPSDIDYVNLHATGTKLNDSMEGKAVDKIFGEYKVPVSGTKSMTGHTLGAAGSLELAACFLAIKNQKLPVHIWDGEQDPDIPELNLVKTPEIGTNKKIRTCMSNSFAFGGCNASLLIRKE